MKIATYNVNGVNGRLPVLLRWLEQSLPDVVCLQELKAPQERFPEAALAAAGSRAIWQGQKSGNGVARLSRGALPLSAQWQSRAGPEVRLQARLVQAPAGEGRATGEARPSRGARR